MSNNTENYTDPSEIRYLWFQLVRKYADRLTKEQLIDLVVDVFETDHYESEFHDTVKLFYSTLFNNNWNSEVSDAFDKLLKVKNKL